MEILIIYPVFIGIAVAMAQYAHSKGHSSRLWFFIGLLLPIISIPFIFLIKPKHKPQTGYHAPVDKKHRDKVLFQKAEQ